MGYVYEGYDPRLNRSVAIKTLTSDALADADSRERFEREARAAAQLQHPNIVTIYELGNFGGNEKPYIVMEYLEGADLAGLIHTEKTIPFSEALDITIQLCKALDYAHQKRVVHRDMKPSNVRWMDDGTVKIMDFGIARIEGETQITKSGMMVGTIHYMSPEQVRGVKLDGRSDIFSTGCILYEILAGARPFVAESATSILYQIVNEPTPQILRNSPELPQEIEAILSKALAKKPDDRYRSAGEMATDLEKLLEVYRKTLARPSSELQERLNELEAMRRAGRWTEVVPLAKTLVTQNPALEGPHKALRTGLRQLQQEEEERRATPDERTRQLAEISREFEFLYGQGRDSATGKEPIVPPTEMGAEQPPTVLKTRRNPLVWPLVFTLLTVVVVSLGWFVLPDLMGPREVSQTLRVTSEPPGALILVNGADTGRVTSDIGVVEVPIQGKEEDEVSVELRLAGYSSAQATLVLGEEPLSPIELTLQQVMRSLSVSTEPTGATIHLDGEEVAGVTPLDLEVPAADGHELIIDKAGFVQQTIKILPGEEVSTNEIVLSPVGRPGTLLVRSAYPLSVVRGGRSVASGSASPSVKLMPGRYEVSLVARDVFLNRTVTAEIKQGETTTIDAPALAKFSVRAFPGNCTLIVDGIATEAPPFDSKAIVVGQHTFLFEWPGATREYKENVVLGETKYVTGRRR